MTSTRRHGDPRTGVATLGSHPLLSDHPQWSRRRSCAAAGTGATRAGSKDMACRTLLLNEGLAEGRVPTRNRHVARWRMHRPDRWRATAAAGGDPVRTSPACLIATTPPASAIWRATAAIGMGLCSVRRRGRARVWSVGSECGREPTLRCRIWPATCWASSAHWRLASEVWTSARETFVEHRFRGTCYRNWVRLGPGEATTARIVSGCG